jgi:hypothetical protein
MPDKFALIAGIAPVVSPEIERAVKVSRDDLSTVRSTLAKRRDPFLRTSELVEALSRRLQPAEAQTIADMIISIGLFAKRRNISVASAMWSFEDSLKASGLADDTLDGLSKLKPVLPALAEHPSIATLVKVIDLSLEYTNAFDNARIVTDIRPIFEDDVERGVIAGIISHVLRLTYLQDGQLKTVSIATDHSDLEH